MPARRVNRENLMHVGNLFREQPHQPAGGDFGIRHERRQRTDTQSRHQHIPQHQAVVGDQPGSERHAQALLAGGELPLPRPFRQGIGQTAVSLQFIRRLRHAVLRQIAGRGANSLVHFTQRPGAEGRIRQPSANAQGNIETGRHHVQYPVVERQLHLAAAGNVA